MSPVLEGKNANSCTPDIECESPAVHSYLNLLQSVINRMASNSASCKSWCITLVSAIIVVLLDKNKAQYIFIALAPTMLFLILDSYYLAMEKRFRERYNAFIKKLHENIVEKKDLFVIAPENAVTGYQVVKSITSISVFPFYTVLVGMITITGFVASDISLSMLTDYINSLQGD